MPSKSSKRTCDAFSETNGTSPSSNCTSKKSRTEPTHDQLWTQIQSLPISTRDLILYDACRRHAQVSGDLDKAVMEVTQTNIATERAKPIADFDRYSRECWYVLTNKYTTKSTSKIKSSVRDMQQEVLKAHGEIMVMAGSNTRYETRRNALEVCRKICKSIMLCDKDCRVRDQEIDGRRVLGEIVESMVMLAKGMSEGERERYQEEGFYEKLVDLKDVGRESDMVDLPLVYSLFERVEKECEVKTKEAQETRSKEPKEWQVEARIAIEREGNLKLLRDNQRETRMKNVAVYIDLDDEIEVVDSR